MNTSIELYSGNADAEGRPELIERLERTYGEDEVRAINAAALAGTDGGMARVVDDLVAALLSKQLLSFDDLPPEAHARLAERSAIRSRR